MNQVWDFNDWAAVAGTASGAKSGFAAEEKKLFSPYIGETKVKNSLGGNLLIDNDLGQKTGSKRSEKWRREAKNILLIFRKLLEINERYF
ncbi:MAG: hypothetical protein QOJ40_1623 [Verrucomicrobiota bacterium]